MDLAIYISELLGLQGEVYVPGIGHFAQVRINGYYNDREGKFYPPTHTVIFEPQAKSDEALAKYISNKKHISLASAKYFIDKYAAGLNQEAATKRVTIAGLGHLYTQDNQLLFEVEQTSGSNNPAFYGFQPIVVNKTSELSNVEEIEPIKAEHSLPVEEEAPVEKVEEISPPQPTTTEETLPQEQPVAEEQATQEEVEEYSYDEPETSGRRNLWIALLLIIIIVLLAILGLYKYKPSWFNMNDKPQTFVAVNPDSVKNMAKADSSKKSTTKADSVTKPATQTINQPIDTLAVVHYELLGGASKSMQQTNVALHNFETLGLHPRLLKHTAGNRYKITLGTYFDKGVAQKAMDSIITATKISKTSIYLQKYNPKK